MGLGSLRRAGTMTGQALLHFSKSERVPKIVLDMKGELPIHVERVDSAGANTPFEVSHSFPIFLQEL